MQTSVSESGLPNIHQKDNFSFKMVLGTIVINLFVYFLIGGSLYNSHLQHDKVSSVSTQNIAKNLEANISGVFDKIDIGVFAVSREVERQLIKGSVNREEINGYIQHQIKQLPEIYGLRVTDADGNLLYGTDIPEGKPANVGDREYFKRLRENPNEEFVISKAIQGRISGKWNITHARRINHPNGSFAGIALAMFDVSYFDKLFSQLDIGKHGALGIRDLDFCLVSLHPKGKEPGSQIGSNVISKKTKEMILANPATATYKTVFARDGKERVVTFRKIARYPFYVFATLAPIDYMTTWKIEAAIVIALLAIFTFATFIAMRMLLRSSAAERAHFVATQYGEEMRRKNDDLNEAMSRIKRLEGIIPICMYCKKIKDDQNSWNQLEQYITDHSEALFSHGMCPTCAEEQMALVRKMKDSR